MIHLIVSACSVVNAAVCHVYLVETEAPDTLPVYACMVGGQWDLHQWSNEHPDLIPMTWKCKFVGDFK